eukprot:4222537-Pleurochrysis_carterae.AAC.1
MGTGLTDEADAHKAAGDCNARGRALCCSRRQRSKTAGGEGQGARSIGMKREWSTVDGQGRTRANEGDRAEGSRVGW